MFLGFLYLFLLMLLLSISTAIMSIIIVSIAEGCFVVFVAARLQMCALVVADEFLLSFHAIICSC